MNLFTVLTKLLFFFGIVFLPLFPLAQESLDAYSIDVLDSITHDLFNKRQFNASLYYNLKLSEKLEQKVGAKDTTYIEAMEYVTLSNYFLGNFETAEKIVQNLLETQAKERGKNNDLYIELKHLQLAIFIQMEKDNQVSKIESEFSNIWKLVNEGKGEENYTSLFGAFVNIHSHLGQSEEEEKLVLSLKRYWKKKEGVEGIHYLETLSVLANIYLATDRNEAGLQLLLQVLETRERLEPTPSAAYIEELRTLATNYSHNDKDDEAEKMFKKAAFLCEKHLGKNTSDYAWVCQKRADFYTYLNREKEAIALYQTANKIFEKTNGKLSAGYTFSLNNMARAYARLNEFDKAEKTLLEVLVLKEQIYGKKHTEYFYTINTLSGLYQQKNDPKMALVYDLKGFACLSPNWDSLPELNNQFLSEIPNANFISTHFTFNALLDLLSTLTLFYNQDSSAQWLEKIYLLCQSGLKYSEKTKNSLANENDQLEILTYYNYFSKLGVWASYKLSVELKGETALNYSKDAFAFAEQNKAVVLAGALKAAQAVQMSDIPQELAFLEKRLKEELGELKKQLMETALSSQKSIIRTQFAEKSKELDALKKDLEKNYPDYYELKYSSHITQVKDIQAILPEKTLCLTYQVGKKVVYIFGITKSNYFVIQKDTLGASIKIHTEELRKNLSDYKFINNNGNLSYSQFTNSAHWFYKELIQPALEKQKDIKNLIIIPDGALGHLPFEVFLTQPAPDLESQENVPNYAQLHYLLNEYTISYSYSASLWAINSQTEAREGNHRMLAMAASYSKDSIDNQIAKQRGEFLTQLRRNLDPLPAAQEEVKSLSESFQGDFFYGNAVNENFFREQAQHYSIIHLAMHGILDNKNPILSGLLFSENKDTLQNNFLQAYEIAHLHLDAELVVLSACETGFGQFQQGEGVMSLARSFMYAGVPSLLVSMWKVNDHSTSVIMKYFYENLYKGMDKAEALRQAKLSYLTIAKGIAAHPAFWSPFIQFGNTSPLQLQGKKSLWKWVLGGFLLVILGGVFVWRRKAIKTHISILIFGLSINAISAQNLEKATLQELDSICVNLVKQRLFDEAISVAQKTVKMAEQQKDSSHFFYLSKLADVYLEAKKMPEAEAIYLEIKASYEKKKITNSINYTAVLTQMAMLYYEIGNYDLSEKYYKQAIEIYKKNFGAKDVEYAKKVQNLANLYNYTDRLEEAEVLYLQTKEILDNLYGKEHPLYASNLNSLGALYHKMEHFQRAESIYNETLILRKKIFGEEHPYYISTLNNLASLYAQTKRLNDAEALFLRIIPLRKKILGEDHPGYSNAINNLAILYQEMEQYAKAEEMFLTTIRLNKKNLGSDHLQYADNLWNLARLYAIQKKYDAAIDLYIQSGKIFEQKLGVHSSDYISVLNSLCLSYYEKRDTSAALKYFDQAIRLNIKNAPEIAPIESISQLSKYEFYTPSATLQSLEYYYFLNDYLSHFHPNKSYLLKAYNAMQASVAISEKLRNSFLAEEDKLRNLEGLSRIVDRAICAGERLEKTEYYSELFSFAELNKSILLSDATKAHRARNMSDLPDSLATKEVELQHLLDELKTQEIQTPNPEEKNLVTKQINETNLLINAFKEKLETNYPKYYKLKYQNTNVSASEIQGLIDEKTLFLEYFISDSVVFLFSISKTKIELYEFQILKHKLSSKIQELRTALTNYQGLKNPALAYQNYTNAAFWFYENLLKKALLNQDKIQNLIIVADGELGHLPFEVFLTKPAVEQAGTNYENLDYLVKKFNISYNYSATLWKENYLSIAPKNNKQILACVGDYSAAFKPQNRALNLLELRKELIELPAAKEEIIAISNSLSGNFWTAAQSNEADFKKQALDYSVIHLAMHGLLNQNHPILSSLAFTDNGDSLEDNFLQAYEIAHLKLNADLVVLSACETGYGKFLQGEGVMSLARSFMYAGVPSLVVSLWQVNDNSTSIIMQLFYKYLSEGMTKDAALRQSKLDYIKLAQGIAAHPAFWSAFIQLGDSRAIEIKTKTNWWYWGIGGLILLILGIAGMAIKRRQV